MTRSCTDSVPLNTASAQQVPRNSDPPPEFLAWLRAEEAARRRPPGIDDWVNELQSEAAAMWSAMGCRHRGFAPGCAGSASAGITYAVQAEGGGLVKIGHSRGIHSRLAEMKFSRLADIQSYSPVRLRIVALMDGIHLERYFHKQFVKQRRHREWFAAEVADWFRANGAPGCVRCHVFKDGKVRTP